MRFYSQRWATSRPEGLTTAGSTTVTHGFDVQPYKTWLFLCYQHVWGLFFISEMTAENLIFLEANQRWHVGVHRQRGAGRRSKTCSSSWWRATAASTVCLLILVRKTQKLFTNMCPFSQYVIYKNRSLYQEQKFPPLQVIEGWEKDCVHRGRGQHISCQAREEHFWRGKCVFGFLNLQCEVRLHFN